ncbi:MAG: guanylate kinase [Chthoniobacteraceae bacterium]
MTLSRRGILFVISAPSGGGKSTLLNLLNPTRDFVYSVSCTTRPPRPGEEHGRDYFFISPEEFEQRVQVGDFLEHARVHNHRYGTLRETVMQNLLKGDDMLIDVDVQGAAAIRHNADAEIRASLVEVFLMPASLQELRRRLLKRGTETPDQVELRLRNAVAEMAEWQSYRYTILSGKPEEDLVNFRAIMLAERMRSHRMSFSSE